MADTITIIAAHADDEVLGCGGSIARHADAGARVHVLLVADGETSRGGSAAQTGDARVAARDAAAQRAGRVLGCASVEMLGLPDNRLDSVALLDVVKPIEAFVAKHRPSCVYTHHAGDVNVDHRVVHDAVLAACRPQPGHSVTELLFFEVPSSTEWRPPGSAPMFAPNWFVDISKTLKRKLDALREYQAELREFPHPRSLQAIEALAQWRGATAGVMAAEAFILGRKLIR